MADTERLDWLERSGGDLVGDDQGHWAVVFTGEFDAELQPPRDDTIAHILIEKEEWQPSIREAIDRAMEEQA